VAYSGGLDTSCILSWLKEDWYGFDEVVAVLVDVGQEFDLEESIVRANAADADDVLLVDRKDAFADQQCARAIVTNALYEGKYPLVSALSRPVIAQAVAEIALDIGAGRSSRVHGEGQRPASLRARLQGALPGREGRRAAPRPHLDRDEEISTRSARAFRSPRRERRPTRSTRTSSAARSRPASSRIRGPGRPTSRTRYLRPSGRASRRSDRHRLREGIPVSLDGAELSSPSSSQRPTVLPVPARDRPDRHDREPRCRHQEP
jgi:hypothetical protein